MLREMGAPILIRRRRFVKALAASLRGPCRVPPGSRIVVATSGGADSVALLRALAALAPQREWSLDMLVAHVDHHLRPDSAAEARFVADLAASLSLRFEKRDIHPGPRNLEAVARRLRYAALAEVAAAHDADFIATAHHADDQLETLLMRLLRGTGPAGMTGVAPRRTLTGTRARLIRPLLHADHAAAVRFLREINQAWCEDPTNTDVSRWRARLRRDVLPVLRDMRPAAAVKAAESADRFREARRMIRRAVASAREKHVHRTGPRTSQLRRDDARRLSREMLAELIRTESRRLGACADALASRTVQRITTAARDPRGDFRRFQLPGGVTIEVTADLVKWTGTRAA